VWRIEADDGIPVGSGDHGQKYDYTKLPPINIVDEATKLLADANVIGVAVDRASADLTIMFENGLRIKLFNNVAFLEAWEVMEQNNGTALVVATPGGLITWWD